MKKYLLSIIILMLVVSSSFGQFSDYAYVALRFGFSNAFSGQPEFNPNKYINAPGVTSDDIQQMQLTPLASAMGYTPGFKGSLLFHFDFTGDAAGLITGLDYNYTGITSHYETVNGVYSMKETHRMHMIGVPLAFKYGMDIWDTQRYIYAGVQFNYIAAMSTSEKVSWANEPGGTKLEGDEFNKTTFSVLFGVNWKVVNVQLDFYPSSVFNDKYTEADQVTEDEYFKYEGQVQQFFKITASVHVPYGWLSEQNFWWRRKLRKVPFWK